MSDYLRKKPFRRSASTSGVRPADSNVNAMVRNVSVQEALAIKEQLAAVPGVTEVLWLDSVVDLLQPLAVQDAETVESFYKDGHALFSVAVAEGYERSACAAIADIIGEDGALSGEAVNLTDMQNSATSEVNLAITILLPAIIVILLLSTTSWLEPVTFPRAIGVSSSITRDERAVRNIPSSRIPSAPSCSCGISMDSPSFFCTASKTTADTTMSVASSRNSLDKQFQQARHDAVRLSRARVYGSAWTSLGLCLAKGTLSFISVVVFRRLRRVIPPRRQDSSSPVFTDSGCEPPSSVCLSPSPCGPAHRTASGPAGHRLSWELKRRWTKNRDILAINEQFWTNEYSWRSCSKRAHRRRKDLMTSVRTQMSGVISFAKMVGTRSPGFLPAV